MNQNSQIHSALKWITNILDRLEIPYQIVGGLAAICYGSTRTLHDIDMYVPGKSISKLQTEVQDYVEFGPAHHKGENWDLVLMKLNYHGQQIEIGDADHTKYFDSRTQQWTKEEINFNSSSIGEFEGIKLPVMPKQQLVEYKNRLNRKVDQIDLKGILHHE